jgi:hypothetical protein
MGLFTRRTRLAPAPPPVAAPPRFLWALVTCWLPEPGIPHLIPRGELWAADDPLVRGHRDYFGTEPPAELVHRSDVAA